MASPGGLHHCIGAGTSPTILGPYVPLNSSLICPIAQGGAIDASSFKDWQSKGYGWGRDPAQWNGWGFSGNDPHNPWTEPSWAQGGSGGQRYVAYKVCLTSASACCPGFSSNSRPFPPQIDGNSLGHGGICGNTVAPIVPTPILLQAVASNGYTLIGAPTTLLDNNGLSDSGVTEAPSLIKAADGTYVLFYSRDCYSSINYTVSYATASSVTGPYTRRADLLVGGLAGEDGGAMNLTGTGGADVLWDGVHMGMLLSVGGTKCKWEGDQGEKCADIHSLPVFHANALSSGFNNDRLLHTAIIDIEGTTVTI